MSSSPYLRSREPPPVQLRAILERHRSGGQSFDSIWERALRKVDFTVVYDVRDRHAWKSALRETEREWRRCYENGPTTLSAPGALLTAEESQRDDDASCPAASSPTYPQAA